LIVPSVHQPLGAHECVVNMKAWQGLTPDQRTVMQKAGRLMVYDLYESEGHNDATTFVELVNGPNEVVDLSQEFKDAAKKATDEWAAAQAKDNEWFARVWKSPQDYITLWQFAKRHR
jgi:TRAP-type mannitol/chloroaromatic compound transport system substrate-binding protein